MNKSYLKQMLTYFSKVYHLGEKINTLKDKRVKSPVKVSTITFVVLFGFMLQIRSFNRLNNWLKKGKLKKVLPKKTKMPRIDAVRRCLNDFDLDGLKDIHNGIVKTTIKNKVFRNGTIDSLKVVVIDGVELFESTKKCCDKCLTRVDKNGTIHYFHRSVVCATVGSDPHLILGQEMLEPKQDGSDKEWIVKKNSNNYRKIKAWDEDNFEMFDLNIKVRFVKFIEEIHTGDKIELKEGWIITTDKFASIETLWKIMHRRWDIENNAFHQLKTEWHLDHFLHSPTGVETVLMFIIIVFNLMQLYFFRCIRGFRRKHMLQIDIIEDIRDERFTIENDWNNPIFIKT